MEREKPNLIRVQVEKEDGTVEHKTIRADQVKVGTVRRHESLPTELTERIKKLYPRAGKLAHPTLAKWLDGFLFDQNPENEVLVWERIADVTDKLWVEQPKQLASLDRKTLTMIVIAVSNGAVDIPSQVKGVTDKQVEIIREAYAAA